MGTVIKYLDANIVYSKLRYFRSTARKRGCYCSLIGLFRRYHNCEYGLMLQMKENGSDCQLHFPYVLLVHTKTTGSPKIKRAI